ncbi:MAG: hypothetical protein ACK2U9_11345 [Anaerolineae bacterium]
MKNLIRSLFSMGLLGWVFLFMALAIALGSYAALSNLDSFEVTWERMDALAALEDQVSVHLREMQLNELYFAYAIDFETPLTDVRDEVAYHAAEIDQILDDLVADGHFTEELDYYPEDIDLLGEFRALLDQHGQSFDEVVQTYESGDVDAAIDDILWLEEENYELQWRLDELVTNLDADRLDAALLFPEDIAFALRGASIALVVMLLLALAGYRAISQLTQPVMDLTNAVIAIGGDRYRPELLGNLLKKSGPAGRFARALDAFAWAIDDRDASLKTEIADLREQLYESRRRRLKISGPSPDGGALS